MKLVKFQKTVKLFTDLKFALLVLGIIAFISSFGTVIEQDETIEYYQQNYPVFKPIYGFINWQVISFFGLDHVYTTWWFLSLLLILGICLVSCTFTRQIPLLENSKEFLFKKQKKSFLILPFVIQFKNFLYLKENILLKLQSLNFYIFQYGNLIYGYKGLIGRVSPILVHISLLIILSGSSWGAFNNFKAQELLPTGEVFHIQNPIKIGKLTNLPSMNVRINDFWVEYENNKIHQFYSNLSILNSNGTEIKTQTISVNNPLHYKTIDFYQSDWNLLGIRIQNQKTSQIYEFPLFPLKQNTKSWITWIPTTSTQTTALIFDQVQKTFTAYDENGKFLKNYNVGEMFDSQYKMLEVIPASGLQIKYDPSIVIIYFGFGLLMLTACLSYLPYTQFWLYSDEFVSWIGSSTNRGKIQLEIDFENLIRSIEEKVSRNISLFDI
jgi:cytochrome c biogenesis protein